jgi:hypothetical protein
MRHSTQIAIIGTLCYFLGVVMVYSMMKTNEEICAKAMGDNVLLPKYYTFDVRMFNVTHHYENGSYFDYPYGKDWADYVASLSAEAGNDTRHNVNYSYREGK